ncbi:MAG: peptide chain release factor N(5)-glutamine methyltransferase [Euzebyales bacterium]|nr:peptide chain release factor N(5)-glutamine methyltransferase [Euzebyales bacterium]MDQ3342288.1 peptide chain release factor N(5)-glutamine methyltransferase [Actinomycetota bacterium]
MTVGEALATTTARLAAAGVPTPDVDARWLLTSVVGGRGGGRGAKMSLDSRRRLDSEANARLTEYVTRRVRREPLQLILGSVGFRHLDLLVRPDVFIPRPETEVLAGMAITALPAVGIVVEPCTGTGAIACAVASEASPRLVVATDTSASAVQLARDNAARAGVAVDVRRGDLLDPVPANLRGQVDVIVANPPYLAARELRGLEPEVVDWDPHDALVAGPTGHEVADRLIAQAPDWLADGGWLLLEVDPARAAATIARMTATGLAHASAHNDLTGAARIVAARKRA